MIESLSAELVTADKADLTSRIKAVDGWDKATSKTLTKAVQAKMLAEVVLPSEKEVEAAVLAEKEAAAGVVYDQRCVLLSVNASPQRTAILCVVREAAIIDGQVKERNTLATFATADAGSGELSPAEQEFVAAIQAAIAKFVES